MNSLLTNRAQIVSCVRSVATVHLSLPNGFSPLHTLCTYPSLFNGFKNFLLPKALNTQRPAGLARMEKAKCRIIQSSQTHFRC